MTPSPVFAPRSNSLSGVGGIFSCPDPDSSGASLAGVDSEDGTSAVCNYTDNSCAYSLIDGSSASDNPNTCPDALITLSSVHSSDLTSSAGASGSSRSQAATPSNTTTPSGGSSATTQTGSFPPSNSPSSLIPSSRTPRFPAAAIAGIVKTSPAPEAVAYAAAAVPRPATA
ncbi:hypothetical protein B0H11DRAFT_2260760 [Mycena galericulata]|nr:hypothetical protein B0H11DRAFT_2260760 [Mycena galericulata]